MKMYIFFALIFQKLGLKL